MQSNKIGDFKSLILQCCLDNIWECNQTKLGISNQDTDKFCGNSARYGGQTKIANSEYWRRRHICKNYTRSRRDVFAKIRFLSRPVFFETVMKRSHSPYVGTNWKLQPISRTHIIITPIDLMFTFKLLHQLKHQHK